MDYNNELINLLILCGKNDSDAIEKYNNLFWANVIRCINFTDNFVLNIENIDNHYSKRILGLMYYYGKGVMKNYEKAKKLFEDAIVCGNSFAFNDLGVMYNFGNGVVYDRETSIMLYIKAIEKNCIYASYNLSKLYFFENDYLNAKIYCDMFMKKVKYNNNFSREALDDFNTLHSHILKKLIDNNIKNDKLNDVVNIINDDENINGEMGIQVSIDVVKKIIENERRMMRREINKTILLMRMGIPMDVIDHEINTKI